MIGLCQWFKVGTGVRYLGSFIGDDDSKLDCLKIVFRRVSGTSLRSEKPRGNIPRKVAPRWYMQSNCSGYFYNASQIIREARLG